jgi:hypothetical protein
MDIATSERIVRIDRRAPLAVVLALVGAFVAQPAGAQSRSAAMGVTVTVTRTCSVETEGTAALLGSQTSSTRLPGQPDVKIRCGNDAVTYPFQPGVSPTPVRGKNTPPVVARTADGRAVTIQF